MKLTAMTQVPDKIIRTNISKDKRVNSIDFFRGFTMFLLIGESTHLYTYINSIDNGFMQFLGTQFNHHQWHGLHFWDLIQPFFMFIVGVAIPFAVANRQKKGDSVKLITFHALKRSLLLLFFGWAIYCIIPGKIEWHFHNVLAQLSVKYMVAFLIRNKSYSFQLIFTLVILLLVELAYRFFPLEGFNHPWVKFENLGAWVNYKIEGWDTVHEFSSLNVIPTTAHTVWGVLFGKLLMSEKTVSQKIRIMIIAGLSGLLIGYSLDLLNVTPIIKKISSSSFVFASGGWAILALCFSYWVIDVKKMFGAGSRMFVILGMNCIFIYLLFEIGGADFITKIFNPFTTSLLSWGGKLFINITDSLVVWASLCYISYWLYKNKIFIKI